MNNNSEKKEETLPPKKSLLFVIEDLAKLLRTEVKKNPPKLTPANISTIRPPSTEFVNNIEQIAKLLRMQVHSLRAKKKRIWSPIKKTRKPFK